MRKVVRHATFESNSSSTHAICVKKDSMKYGTITPDINGTVTLNQSYFGSSFQLYNTPIERAEYALAYIVSIQNFISYSREHQGKEYSRRMFGLHDGDKFKYMQIFKTIGPDVSKFRQNLMQVIKQHTGCIRVNIIKDPEDNAGINHQAFQISSDKPNLQRSTLQNAFGMLSMLADKKMFKQLIFNNRFCVVTSGDGDGIDMQNLKHVVDIRYKIKIDSVDQILQVDDYLQIEKDRPDLSYPLDTYERFGLTYIPGFLDKYKYKELGFQVNNVNMDIRGDKKYLIVDYTKIDQPYSQTMNRYSEQLEYTVEKI